ncbi:MAG: GntR family transcriptional regulator [Mycobacterium sp.]
MPKKYGVKEKDVVVAHVVDLVLTGRFRTGDRIDRNAVARELGISRVPIQEAMVQLEHDGIVSTRYHRGAFVERFDGATVVEHHEIFGLLNGLASARAADDPNGRILPRLEALVEAMRSTTEAGPFQDAVWAYRQAIHDDYAGPRLLALIRASQSFMPRAFWSVYQGNHAEMLPFYEAETDAIRRHDCDAARAVNAARAELMAQIMVAELAGRSVLNDVRSG